MFTKRTTDSDQFVPDELRIRALIDFTALVGIETDAAEMDAAVMRHPFRLATRGGMWSGAFLPADQGALVVECDLMGQSIPLGPRLKRDLSWSLRQTGIYSRETDNLGAWQGELCDLQERGKELISNGWHYNTTLILNVLRALGAPDPRFARGHFTGTEPRGDAENSQVLALAGTLARTRWRAFVLPVIKRDSRSVTEDKT